jgi:hypothetical protein
MHKLSSCSLLVTFWTLGHLQPAASQTLRFADLEGYSIAADYQEMVTTRRSGSFQQTWSDRIYFSTKGRIFHRFSRQSTRPEYARSRESVSDEEGQGDGHGVSYHWTGSGIAREWTNRRGNRIRQSITITPTSNGYVCQISVERFAGRGTTISLGQTCQVIKGNILAAR